MKKIVFAIAAALMMTAGVTAQEQNDGERNRPTQEQMIQHRTDGMVKKYNLNEEQAAKLLELNKKYSDQMGSRRGGMRPNAQGGQRHAPDSVKGQPGKERGKFDVEAMKKKMEEYDTQLQTILTKEQYEAYKADREKMRQQGPRGGRRQHKN